MVGVLRGRCSEYMLRGPDGTPLRPDVVWFNFGFHSLNENAARPEYGLRNYESAYEADLDRVAGVLTNWSRDLRPEHSPPTLLCAPSPAHKPRLAVALRAAVRPTPLLSTGGGCAPRQVR